MKGFNLSAWAVNHRTLVLFLMLALDLNDAKGRLQFGQKLGDASYGIYLWHIPIQLTLVLIIDSTGLTRDIAREGWFLILFVTTSRRS